MTKQHPANQRNTGLPTLELEQHSGGEEGIVQTLRRLGGRPSGWGPVQHSPEHMSVTEPTQHLALHPLPAHMDTKKICLSGDP